MTEGKKNRVAILQSNYVPWKGYFDIIGAVDKFVLYDEVQFTKNDWRNRNKIKSKDGLQWLSIAVRQESLHQRIDETKIAFNNWNRKHWNAIVASYSRAESFREVKDFLEELYLTTDSEYLHDVNRRFIVAINAFLGIGTEIIDSRDLRLQGDRNEKLVDACEKLGASVYLSGPSAMDYLDLTLFAKSQIDVEWVDYSGYAEYPQLFPPFIHGVSILDLILNTGYNARKYLKCSTN